MNGVGKTCIFAGFTNLCRSDRCVSDVFPVRHPPNRGVKKASTGRLRSQNGLFRAIGPPKRQFDGSGWGQSAPRRMSLRNEGLGAERVARAKDGLKWPILGESGNKSPGAGPSFPSRFRLPTTTSAITRLFQTRIGSPRNGLRSRGSSAGWFSPDSGWTLQGGRLP